MAGLQFRNTMPVANVSTNRSIGQWCGRIYAVLKKRNETRPTNRSTDDRRFMTFSDVCTPTIEFDLSTFERLYTYRDMSLPYFNFSLSSDRAYKNSHHNDLWAALTEQARKDGVMDSSFTIKTIMDTWILQPGFPVVNVTRNYQVDTLMVSQVTYSAGQQENMNLVPTVTTVQ